MIGQSKPTVQLHLTSFILVYPFITLSPSGYRTADHNQQLLFGVFFFVVVVFSLSQATADALRVEFNYVYLEKCIHVNFSASFFTF